jgi:hypothetical protein
VASSSVHAQSIHYVHDNKELQGAGPETDPARLNIAIPSVQAARDSYGRRNAMMTVALVAAMYYGAILIFCLIGLLGMCMEMALKK